MRVLTKWLNDLLCLLWLHRYGKPFICPGTWGLEKQCKHCEYTKVLDKEV